MRIAQHSRFPPDAGGRARPRSATGGMVCTTSTISSWCWCSWACRRWKGNSCEEQRPAPPCTCNCRLLRRALPGDISAAASRPTVLQSCEAMPSLGSTLSPASPPATQPPPQTRVRRGSNAVGGRGSSFSIGMATQDPWDARRVSATQRWGNKQGCNKTCLNP